MGDPGANPKVRVKETLDKPLALQFLSTSPNQLLIDPLDDSIVNAKLTHLKQIHVDSDFMSVFKLDFGECGRCE